MKLVFYSLILNHHQACVADEFYKILGDDYAFVETAECHDSKGGAVDYSQRPYLVKAWSNPTEYAKAMQMALEADVCVFGGYEALPFEKARVKRGLLSFDMGERMLKRGWLNLASPRILKMVMAYHIGGWSKKPIYKLCCSAFGKGDQYKLRSFRDRCYKWGYFIDVPTIVPNGMFVVNKSCIKFMWCARLLKLKHPELIIKMAQNLKREGYGFHLDIYGDEGNAAPSEEVYTRNDLEHLTEEYGVKDVVTFYGNKPNDVIIKAMQEHDVFLFTSDQHEGWGAVVNESMANGCAVISSNVIGSTGYLVKEGKTGFSFNNLNSDSLTEKAKWLIEHPVELEQMKKQAYTQMRDIWSPRKAAEALLALTEDLKNGREVSILKGPCSKA